MDHRTSETGRWLDNFSTPLLPAQQHSPQCPQHAARLNSINGTSAPRPPGRRGGGERSFATYRVHSLIFFFLAACAWEKEASIDMPEALWTCECSSRNMGTSLNMCIMSDNLSSLGPIPNTVNHEQISPASAKVLVIFCN